jgi:type IV pilus assembly protein PilM
LIGRRASHLKAEALKPPSTRADHTVVSLLKRPKKSKAVVGLEIEPSHLAAAEVQVNGKVSVTRGAVSMLRPGLMRDGEVSDAEELASTLRDFFDEHDLPRAVRLGVANQRIVVRTLDLPPVDEPRELAQAVRFQAPDHIPMPIDEAVVDFQSLGRVETASGPKSRVVVVAVRRDMVEKLAAVTQDAGLKLVGIDLSAFAMIRALDVEMPRDEAVLYVNVGGLTNVAVASGDSCLFTRTAPGGVESIAATLAERGSLTMEHARQWLTHVGLETPVEDVAGDPEIVGAARTTLTEGVHHLADAVRNSLNFYRMQEASRSVERAVLTGAAVEVPGFADELGRQLRLPVASAVVAGEVESSSRLVVAAGLAVDRRPGG